jgi:hypothetical protein
MEFGLTPSMQGYGKGSAKRTKLLPARQAMEMTMKFLMVGLRNS